VRGLGSSHNIEEVLLLYFEGSDIVKEEGSRAM
jgi:hypothetical protein